MYCNL